MKLLPTKRFSILSALTPIMAVSLSVSGLSMAEDHEESPLAQSMDQTSDALKLLRKIDKDDWAAGAAAAREAAAGIAKGMLHLPALVVAMPEGKEKSLAAADYRKVMGEAYIAICELELGYLEEDQEKIDAAVAKIKATKKEGHKKYEDE